MSAGAVLAFDFGSRVASAAVAEEGRLLAALASEREARDSDLLPLLERTLAAAGRSPRGLGAIVALAGPGSFTGLRVACATALGLGTALGVPAAGFPTLAALAASAPPGAGRVLAVVDALRGEWYVQPFARSFDGVAELEPPRILSAGAAVPAVDLVVGVDAERFVGECLAGERTGPVPALAAVRIAEAAALEATRSGWRGDPVLLRRPLYLRAPAVRLPARAPAGP